MSYIIEEFYGDTYVKISEAKTQKEALQKMRGIHQQNLNASRKSGVRVMKDNIVVDSLETEKQASTHELQK